jgi:hypothetical protein
MTIFRVIGGDGGHGVCLALSGCMEGMVGRGKVLA